MCEMIVIAYLYLRDCTGQSGMLLSILIANQMQMRYSQIGPWEEPLDQST